MQKKKVVLVCPVYNEEECVRNSVEKLVSFSRIELPDYDWKIAVVDNASTDKTGEICTSLELEFPREFKYIRLIEKGKGLAVRNAWNTLDFDYSIYMDIDLSTDLNAVLPTLKLLETNDLVIGTRKMSSSKVIGRSTRREFTSFLYIFVAKTLASMRHITDFQCGFKGITKEAAKVILPTIIDNTWYFDSELIVNTHKLGFKIAQVPVIWTDDPGTTVKIRKVTQVLLFGLYRNLSEKTWQSGISRNPELTNKLSFFDHFVESIKFGFVGIVCFLVDMIIAVIYQHFAPDVVATFSFNNYNYLLKDIYVAVVLGFVLSVPLNFYLNRIFTFKRTEEKILSQAIKFIPILIFGILVKVVSAFVWTDLLGLYKVLAVPFSSIVMLVSNYIGHKYFTFRK